MTVFNGGLPSSSISSHGGGQRYSVAQCGKSSKRPRDGGESITTVAVQGVMVNLTNCLSTISAPKTEQLRKLVRAIDIRRLQGLLPVLIESCSKSGVSSSSTSAATTTLGCLSAKQRAVAKYTSAVDELFAAVEQSV